MTVTPLYSAIPVLRNAVCDALGVLMAAATPPVGLSYLDSAGRVKCYWTQADQADANGRVVVPPCVIAQSQDDGGRAVKTIGELGWGGLITVRALAKYLAYAEVLMNAVAPAMESLSTAGYSITAVYERPVTIPPRDGIWQAAHQWRVSISTL
jgi:hypothetical protein